MFSRVCQQPWLPILFSYTFSFAKYNATTQSIYTAFVSNYFLAFIYNFSTYIYMSNYYSLVCFELYIEMFTHYFSLDFFILILCFQLSLMILDIVGVHSFHYYLVSHSMNIILFIHSLLIEIILVPVLATTSNSSLNILVHRFG